MVRIIISKPIRIVILELVNIFNLIINMVQTPKLQKAPDQTIGINKKITDQNYPRARGSWGQADCHHYSS